ncbi:hypothetical protein [Segniliparus rugosus]|uniref:Uncharacterized protein n=1 Tax=Segniliparus rugosus (strain ATCC BAA-974 / DSM 45345 / CCUG 50838 / CIP 108380 / JCM 13579 / CDC 945) TaxID=679197 RepID=E5XMR6_SEGRC|nr:hypothetical protein [Segniliparus rugosus]EFV14336.1 hypothetical protein HMPREF9336_00786 [Segniliparus rugosus ATCC BAA-974]
MKMKTPAPGLLYVSVSDWEYGCCGQVPAEGNSLAGTVTAWPADIKEQFQSPPVLDWNREFELVRFAAYSASWDPRHGDPRAQPIRLGVSWHGGGNTAIAPRITAEIAEVYQESVLYRRSGRSFTAIQGTYEHTRMAAVERFPEEPDAEPADGETVRRMCGAVLGVRVSSYEEPSAEALAEHRAALERASRTIQLTGPAVVFGQMVPGRGDRLAVDLGDPRLQKTGNHAERTHVVRGEAGQVSAAHEAGGYGGTWYNDVAPGTPAHTVAEPLFVVLTIDAEDLG